MKKKEVVLKFDNKISFNQKGKHVRDGLSSALRIGNNLFVCCDERSTLERLTLDKHGNYSDHVSFDLAKYIRLPESDSGEIDVEGLGLDEKNQILWIVGSHSLNRKKPKKETSHEKQIARLSKVESDPKRFILARIPLIEDVKGNYGLCRTCVHPKDKSKIVSAAQLISAENGNQLTELLHDDPHFKNFMNIPGKDNGFDIEGLEFANGKLFIGVRGPVLRGWAVIIEVEVEDVADGYFQFKKDPKGKLYKKHFLHMDGMGVRDLYVSGKDIYVLAGPTMVLDGTIAVYLWKKGAVQVAEVIVHRKELKRLFDVPHGTGKTKGQDKAEGMTMWDENHFLMVFDSPTEKRKPDEHSVIADLYKLK